MSKYTEKQAAAKAEQIFERFGSLIHAACSTSSVPEDFLGGFVGVEAGVGHNGQIDVNATRFEAGVYHHLLSVRDGLLKSYNGITHGDLVGMADDAVRNLATSWGITQIMGWHMVHNLKGTIADLRDEDKHLRYTVQLLNLTAAPYLRSHHWENVLRIWNSGTANGKTYDPDYVHNALAVKAAYAAVNSEEVVEQPAVMPAVSDIPPVKSAEDPIVSSPLVTAQPSLGERIGEGYEAATGKFDSVNNVVSGVAQRADSVKSFRATFWGTLKQIVWALFAFMTGMPWYIYLSVAVLTALMVLLYIHRQTVLGKIRELAKSPQAAATGTPNVTATSEVKVT